MNAPTRRLLPFLIVFLLVNIVVISAWKMLADYGINNYVILAANGLFFLSNVVVFFIQKNALSNTNPNVFIRSVMSGMMIKMFLCVIAVLAYTLLSGPAFNKKAVFISMFLYLIYLAAEVIALTRLNKQHNA
ncbi:MAG: hypothetical protein JWQ27_3160 [Ferruginibacter sp.]|nr:hypothetical protein [Ferruginibacter sp.]